MKQEEKIGYMRIAASLANFGFTDKQLDLLVSLYELVILKKGKTSIEDVVRIEHMVNDRESAKLVKAVEDNIEKPVSKALTMISYRKYQGSSKKTYVFEKPFNSLGVEEIESTLSEVTGVPNVYKWWKGTIEQEPEYPAGEVQ